MAAFLWGLPPVGYFIGYLLSFGAVKWLEGRLRDAGEGTVFLTLVAASLSIALGFGGLVTRVILKKSGIEMGALRIVRLNMEAVFCFMLSSLFVSMFMPCQQCAPREFDICFYTVSVIIGFLLAFFGVRVRVSEVSGVRIPYGKYPLLWLALGAAYAAGQLFFFAGLRCKITYV